MPIISSEPVKKKERIKIDINAESSAEIQEYMKWANITDLSFFFEEAANFVLSKDKEWKQYKKNNK